MRDTFIGWIEGFSTWTEKAESEVSEVKSVTCVWLFATPMDYSLPCSSIRGILQARMLEWVAISFSRRSSQHSDRTSVSRIAGRRFTICATRGALGWGVGKKTAPWNHSKVWSLQNDNGTSFTSKVTQRVSKVLGITYYLHCAWRSQSSGKVERANQFLKLAIK